MSYQLVEQLHKKAVPVGRLCRVLGVSRSGYYGCRQRAKLAPKACLVSTQLKAEFAASGKVYGSRRLSAVLCAQGLRIGRHRVRRLMREHGLRSLWRRKFVHTTDSGHALPISANVLAETVTRGKISGFHGYLTKPINIEALVAAITAAVERSPPTTAVSA